MRKYRHRLNKRRSRDWVWAPWVKASLVTHKFFIRGEVGAIENFTLHITNRTLSTAD